MRWILGPAVRTVLPLLMLAAGHHSAGAIGACCLTEGACEETSIEQCAQDGGSFQGEGVPCDPNPCPQASFGACCLSDGTCEVIYGGAHPWLRCEKLGGIEFIPDVMCDPNPCGPIGACCRYTGGCILWTSEACAEPNVYRGDDTDCGPECDIVGACCLPSGKCYEFTRHACEYFGALYLGDGAICSEIDCTDPPGACCYEDGSCLFQPRSICEPAGGLYLGRGVPCGAEPCPPPVPTGAASWGRIKQHYR